MARMNDLFTQAERAMLSGDYEQARASLVSLVAVNPQHDAAWLLLARLTDDPKQKEECYARAVAINSHNREYIVDKRGPNGSTPIPTLLSLDTGWADARAAFAQAKQAFTLALVATGRRPEDSHLLRELNNVEHDWTKPIDAYASALDLYDQALKVIPGSHSFMDERKRVALRLQDTLQAASQSVDSVPARAAPESKEPALHQAELIARRLYGAYGKRLTNEQGVELLATGKQMLNELDAAERLDPRATRARITTSLVFTSALDLLLDLTTRRLADCTEQAECKRAAAERARVLDYLHRLEQTEAFVQAQLETAADTGKLQVLLNAIQARRARVAPADAPAPETALRASELLEFADALVPLVVQSEQPIQTLKLGQRILQIIEEVLRLDAQRAGKWVRGSGKTAMQKYARMLDRQLRVPGLTAPQQIDLTEQRKRLDEVMN